LVDPIDYIAHTGITPAWISNLAGVSDGLGWNLASGVPQVNSFRKVDLTRTFMVAFEVMQSNEQRRGDEATD
jgi:hypothetical protein